jgi:hypothetical protein
MQSGLMALLMYTERSDILGNEAEKGRLWASLY